MTGHRRLPRAGAGVALPVSTSIPATEPPSGGCRLLPGQDGPPRHRGRPWCRAEHGAPRRRRYRPVCPEPRGGAAAVPARVPRAAGRSGGTGPCAQGRGEERRRGGRGAGRERGRAAGSALQVPALPTAGRARRGGSGGAARSDGRPGAATGNGGGLAGGTARRGPAQHGGALGTGAQRPGVRTLPAPGAAPLSLTLVSQPWSLSPVPPLSPALLPSPRPSAGPHVKLAVPSPLAGGRGMPG